MREEERIIAAERARRRAIETGDVDALEAIVADPFHYAHITGMIEDRAAYFTRVRRNPRLITATSATQLRITLRPNHALMHGRSVIVVDPALGGRDVETLFLAVWEPHGTTWKITAYASTPLPQGVS